MGPAMLQVSGGCHTKRRFFELDPASSQDRCYERPPTAFTISASSFPGACSFSS